MFFFRYYVFLAVFMPNGLELIIVLILAIIVGDFLGLQWKTVKFTKKQRIKSHIYMFVA